MSIRTDTIYLLNEIKNNGVRELGQAIKTVRIVNLMCKIAKPYGFERLEILRMFQKYSDILINLVWEGRLDGYLFYTYNDWKHCMLKTYPFEDFLKEQLKSEEIEA